MAIPTYGRVNWQDSPSTATPTSAADLNTMDAGINTLYGRTALVDDVSTLASDGPLIFVVIGASDALPAAGTKGRILFQLPFNLP